MLGPVVQNKHFGFYFKYNGKSLKAFKQNDMIQTIFQSSLVAVRGRTCSEQPLCAPGRDHGSWIPLWSTPHHFDWAEAESFLSVLQTQPALDRTQKGE